ncbi:MAG: threonine--tRNA ligase [Phycisphaeraceae bacterium]|nr:threonine--tRNA ligase [Phycisphaeraceae bacterium]
MPTITLPDGSQKHFEHPVSAADVAKSIGAGLAKAALGCKVDGELRDLSTLLDKDCRLSIVTPTTRDKKQDPDALFLIRHSAAHVMAEAIQRIIPGAQLVYGPPLEDKFYYDIKFPDNRPLKDGDFPAIEAEMAKIVAEDRPFTRYEVAADQGLGRLLEEKNKYKVDNAVRALEAQAVGCAAAMTGVVNAPVSHGTNRVEERSFRYLSDSTLSFYATGTPGQNWEDLCRGPHVPSTGRIGAFKILSLASSYWHGDEKSDRLTRVYGTAFASKADLDTWLTQREEAAKRDHRVIGKALRLFHIDEDVGQGLILWTPAGSVLRQELMRFIGDELNKQGYHQVFTPHIGKLDLYKTSGHFPYYKDAQYPPIPERDALDLAMGVEGTQAAALAAGLPAGGCSCAELMHRLDGVSARLAAQVNERTQAQTIGPDRVQPDEQLLDGYLLKPMNCPHHIKIFASAPHSYRDLPVRLAEFGTVYRWEQSGELNGMTRVRGFTQDDAHLFCTEDQVPEELLGCLSLVKTVLTTLNMTDYRVRVGLRDPDSNKYTGNPENWDRAEQACRLAAKSLGVPFTEEPGEAAFYGPKIDFVVRDVIGREWQLGTVQVDYNLPIRFDLTYTGPDNQPHRPVMIHRAPFGSFERFCGVLIEHFAGSFPTWLSPEQVRVLPISEKSDGYAKEVLGALKVAGCRATCDFGNDRIQGKIKVAADLKIPYLLIVGPRDAEQRSVSVRARGQEKDLGSMPLDRFVEAIKSEIETRRADLGVKP